MPKLIQLQRPSHDDIATLARQIWGKKGRPAGQDVECWFQAEQQLLHSCSKPRPRRATKGSRGVQPVRGYNAA
jgi:hypothetical protein